VTRLALVGGLLAAGLACATPDGRAEKLLTEDGGLWLATTFTYVDRYDPTTNNDYQVYEEQVLEDVEFFLSEEEGTTAGSFGDHYHEGEIRLPDGWVVPIDWHVGGGDDLDLTDDRVWFWMLLYEDVGVMSAGDWAADPTLIEEPPIALSFYTLGVLHDYQVEIVLEKP
jgi:hypothetical protein